MHVNYGVIKYVVIKYKLNNNGKNECNFFYCININLCVGIDIKTNISKLTPMWLMMENWNVTSILTTLH
jgi:hypothetical protein